MILLNRRDRTEYLVSTEDDGQGGFMIMATPLAPEPDAHRFVMHYDTLRELCEDWEDID